MITCIVLLALGAVMSAVFIVSKVTNYSLKTIIFKTVASLFFVALGIYCVATSEEGNTAFKVLTLLGLIFGTLGDVLLGFKYITTKTKKLWILLGMFAFAAGHIFYIVALFVGYYIPGNPLFIVLPFVTAVAISAIYLVVAKKVGIDFNSKLLPFAIFYLMCLTTMFSASFYMALLNQFNEVTIVMFFVGASFFAASDFMLTGSYFKPGQRPKAYNAVYSVCYYLAQFIIAFSIFFL